MIITVTLTGRDAEQALKELLSNIEYDRLNVRIQIQKEKQK